MSTVTATLPAPAGHARAETASGPEAGFALLLGALEEDMPDGAALAEDTIAPGETKLETAEPLPDPTAAPITLVLLGSTSPAAAAPIASTETPATTLAGAGPPADSHVAWAGLPGSDTSPTVAEGLPDAAVRDPAAAAPGPRPAPVPNLDPVAVKPDPALQPGSASGPSGVTTRPPQPMAASVPILVEDATAPRTRTDGAAPRPARGATAAGTGPRPGESTATARALDGPAPAPGIVAAADIRFQQAHSGPERTEAGQPETSGFPLSETLADDPDAPGPDPRSHVQSARLSVGIAERLSITLAATTEASRALLERETPQLASDLAAAGAKVEAIRVDLAVRVNPDGRADAAGGPHPGTGQGGGAPWDRGTPPGRADAPAPDAPAELRRPGQARAGTSDGGKVDRYA